MPRILDLDPVTYQRHPLHREERLWAETNCYSDVIIELLHAMGFEPLAALPFTLGIDFDVDQWTFFKFPHADIERLYGLGIYELAPWRPLAEHVEAHVAAGRPVLVEMDSFFLPDTAGTAYKIAHVKSTVAITDIDVSLGRMGYFHNQGYYWLEGQDFADAFQVGGLVHERMMPPYIEFVKPLPRGKALQGRDLVEGSLALLRDHLAKVPAANPFRAFQERMARDVDWLLGAEIDAFHAYSFATLRQYGACYQLTASYLRWLGQREVPGAESAADAFDQISRSTKALQFQLARAMARKRPFELTPLGEMAALWERGMDDLTGRFGR